MSGLNKNNIENCDLMENLVPLWDDKSLSERERILTYVCVVLNERCCSLTNRINELEKKFKTTPEPSKTVPKGLMGLNIGGHQIINPNQIGGSSTRNNNIIDTPRPPSGIRNNQLISGTHNHQLTSGTHNHQSKSYNPYLKEELVIENSSRRKHDKDKKSSKKNIYEIKKSIKDVKKTLEEIKRSSKKH